MKKKRSYPLEPGEKEIVEAFEKGKLKPLPNSKELVALLQSAAEAHLRKDSRITIRLPSGDINALKHIAGKEGLPYQTLIASVLHKFVAKRLRP